MSADAGKIVVFLSIVDVLFRSGDIRDRSAKSSEIAPKKHVFRPKFLGEYPQILHPVFKIAAISDHVAKFRGDRPRDCGDLALKKKIKKETAAKHKGRVALSQRAALITTTTSATRHALCISVSHITTSIARSQWQKNYHNRINNMIIATKLK